MLNQVQHDEVGVMRQTLRAAASPREQYLPHPRDRHHSALFRFWRYLRTRRCGRRRVGSVGDR